MKAAAIAIAAMVPTGLTASSSQGDVDIARVCVSMVGIINELRSFAAVSNGSNSELQGEFLSTISEHSRDEILAKIVLGAHSKGVLWGSEDNFTDLFSTVAECISTVGCERNEIIKKADNLSRTLLIACELDFRG